MFKMLFFVVFIPATIMLMGAFINGLIELKNKEREERKKILREGIEGYLDQVFGHGTAKIFRSIFDAEGILRYIIYLPQYKWFKSPTYQWFEVYETEQGFHHIEIER